MQSFPVEVKIFVFAQTQEKANQIVMGMIYEPCEEEDAVDSWEIVETQK